MSVVKVLSLCLVFSLVNSVVSIPEQGIISTQLNSSETTQNIPVQITKFSGSYFLVKFRPQCVDKNYIFSVQLHVYDVKCAEITESQPQSGEMPDWKANSLDYVSSANKRFLCKNDTDYTYFTCPECHWTKQNVSDLSRNNNTKTLAENEITVNKDGIYLLVLTVDFNEAKGNLSVIIESRDSYGYLSAADWPQLPFYRIVFVIYLFYTLVWIVLCCCYRSDLLRIQYWIGGVLFMGLLEKAVFLGEYETVNKSGQSVYGAVIVGELVSSAKKMLSRMLVIVVCVGFGIVKPRLGTTLHKVLAVGFVYFIASSVEGCLRAMKERIHPDNKMMLGAYVLLSVVDTCICWWIFSSLIQTMRILRLRRNVVKLTLYRHFTNTLIFAVLASLGFMIWSIIEYRLHDCYEDWKELWVLEAFWHLLFIILLLVIMILWRPSANNQRYAYSPLTDAADEESEEPMIHEAFDGIKMRGTKAQDANSTKADTQMDDDLKWIEDNIPASVVDSALPSLIDSEEEIVTATYERGKMQ